MSYGVAIMSPFRTGAVAVAGVIERTDGVLRRWPIAGELSLLVLVILFIAAMLS